MFPMFVDISNKSCIVIGAGEVAYRKISTLLNYGALITVISPKICTCIFELNQNSKLKIIERKYRYSDLENAYMVLACATQAVNIQVCNELKNKNIFFNCAKPSEYSNFMFPAVINRGALTIGISTNGASPSLCSHIKKQIDDVLPINIGEYIEVLAKFRLKVMSEIQSPKLRQKILKKVTTSIDYSIEPKQYSKNILELLEVLKNEN